MEPVIFRTDGNNAIGYGHLARCLALARLLRNAHEIVFLMSQKDEGYARVAGEYRAEVERPGVLEGLLGEGAVAVVTDTRLPRLYMPEDLLLSRGVLHMSVTDLGLAAPPSDLLVDGSIKPLHYGHPPAVREFLGPAFMILDPIFWALRKTRCEQGSGPPMVLVALGDGPPPRFLSRVLEGLTSLGRIARLSVAVPASPEDRQVPMPAPCRPVVVKEDFPALLKQADVAVICGDLALYQAACLAVPTVVLSRNRIEDQLATAFEKAGASLHLGPADEVCLDALEASVRYTVENPPARMAMGSAGLRVCDGQGVFRVASILDKALAVNQRNEERQTLAFPCAV